MATAALLCPAWPTTTAPKYRNQQKQQQQQQRRRHVRMTRPQLAASGGAEEGRLGVSCTLCACGMCEFFIKIQVTSKGLTAKKGDARGEVRGVGWKKGDSLCCVSVCVCVGVDSDNCDDIFCTCSLSKHAHISLLLPSTPHTHHLSHLSSATSTWLILLPIIGTHFGFKLQIIATIRDRSSTSPPPTFDLLISKIYSRQFHLPQRR